VDQWTLYFVRGPLKELSYELTKSFDGHWIVDKADFDPRYQVANAGVIARNTTNKHSIGRIQGYFDCVDLFYRSSFSWVSPNWRRRGLAIAMWDLLLAELHPVFVTATAVSSKGLTLLNRVKALHPEVEIRVHALDGTKDLKNEKGFNETDNGVRDHDRRPDVRGMHGGTSEAVMFDLRTGCC